MQFHDYSEHDPSSFILNQPLFDVDRSCFISKIIDNKDANINLKSSNLRLTSVQNDIIKFEFLHSSNDFYKFINNLDATTKGQIIRNGAEWFGNSLNTDTINNIFKYSAYLPDKLPSFPYINFIIDKNCKIIGKRRKKLTVGDLRLNMEFEVCFAIDGLYFYKNKCHLVYVIHQLKLINELIPSTGSFFGTECESDDNNGEINIGDAI